MINMKKNLDTVCCYYYKKILSDKPVKHFVCVIDHLPGEM